MNKEDKIEIVGPPVKTVWGREVDLREVSEKSIKNLDGYKFLHLTFKRLQDFKDNPKSMESLNNVGIRAENKKDEDAIRSLHADYTRDGVDLTYPIPPITLEGELLDARGRTHTHLDYNQDFMAVAVYQYIGDSNKETLKRKTAGLVSNNHKRPAKSNSINDFISCAISLQSSGHLGSSDTEVEEWLTEDAGLCEAFPSVKNRKNGLLTKIKKAIKNKTVSNIKKMLIHEVVEWCNSPIRDGFPNVDDVEVVLLNSRPMDYFLRFFKNYQKNYSESKEVKIILWTTQKDYNTAKEDMANAEEILQNHWVQMNRILGLDIGDNLRPMPWKIIGCVPQFEDEGHVLDSRTLINPEDY